MGRLDDALRDDLEQLRLAGRYRRHRITESPQAARMRIDGRDLVSFCSNDYLGLARHPDLREALCHAVERFGVGSGSAHLVNGHSRLHAACEQRLAEFTGRDRALLFSTGYMANLAVATALCDRRDVIFQDRLNHASLIDGARLSDARLLRYRHGDLQQLDRLLEQRAQARRRMIMVDGVFSMDGDLADLAALARLAERRDAWLMVDDAHGFGVLGERGAGICAYYGLGQDEVPVLMATLGKAVGVFGAFVAGSETLIETLIQKARSHIFTTAAPPALAAAVMRSLDLIEQEDWRRDKLQSLIGYFREQAAARGLELMDSPTAIQPLIIGDDHRAVAVSERLFEQGFLVTAIRPPTVPEGTARLRITLSVDHETADIDALLEVLAVLI
jgi:8-amino-7-oxononanoate synthase